MSGRGVWAWPAPKLFTLLCPHPQVLSADGRVRLWASPATQDDPVSAHAAQQGEPAAPFYLDTLLQGQHDRRVVLAAALAAGEWRGTVRVKRGEVFEDPHAKAGPEASAGERGCGGPEPCLSTSSRGRAGGPCEMCESGGAW